MNDTQELLVQILVEATRNLAAATGRPLNEIYDTTFAGRTYRLERDPVDGTYVLTVELDNGLELVIEHSGVADLGQELEAGWPGFSDDH